MGKTFNILSLFSGIGGLDMGFKLRYPWARTVMFCENDKFCQSVLKKRFPNVPIWEDVYDLQGQVFAEEGIAINWIIGGFPCQAFSQAGKRQGTDDPRGTLFWQIVRLAGEIREAQGWSPNLFLENVPGLLNMRNDDASSVFGEMLLALHEHGYDARWATVGAYEMGAPHIRNRVWIMAYPQRYGCDERAFGRGAG